MVNSGGTLTEFDVKIQDWVNFCQEKIDSLSFETDYDRILYPDGYVYKVVALEDFKIMLDNIRAEFKHLVGQTSESGQKKALFDYLIILAISLSNAKKITGVGDVV